MLERAVALCIVMHGDTKKSRIDREVKRCLVSEGWDYRFVVRAVAAPDGGAGILALPVFNGAGCMVGDRDPIKPARTSTQSHGNENGNGGPLVSDVL